MGQLAGLALLALVGWLVWKNVSPRIAGRRSAVENPKREAKTLEPDPRTGVYRPTEQD